MQDETGPSEQHVQTHGEILALLTQNAGDVLVK